jgi:RNA-splicing ligase RtcB
MKNLKIFTSNIDETAKNQVNLLLEQDAFKDCKVRIMPDVHAGAGCVIGFTANLGDKVIPNIVGVDIGCGMAWTKLQDKNIDLAKLDNIIKNSIPSGLNVYNYKVFADIDLTMLHCYGKLKSVDRLECSLGTLGDGNHFIEIDKAENGDLYLVVHSGSRNLGKQVCDIYQEKAIEKCSFKEKADKEIKNAIAFLIETGNKKDIEKTIKSIREKYGNKTKLPKDLCYLTEQDRQDYLDDMRLCQKWATRNRERIIETICLNLGIYHEKIVHTVHNYISNDNIVRKGAISCQKNEIALIPMNMKDGCLIVKGKGNKDWNCSAPHGAGRIMSRAQAKNNLLLDDYKNAMKDVFSTCISNETIDEAPMVYKPMEEIINNIKDTAEIIGIIKPIYNFKAGE